MATVEELVEKWEASGLLETVISKETVASLLELAAINLLNLSNDGKDVGLEATLTFPIIHRAFKSSAWSVSLDGQQSTEAVATFVTLPPYDINTDDKAPDRVAESAASLALLLESKTGRVITNIEIQPRNTTGFFILVHLA